MASLSSKTFIVGIPNVSDSAFRAARRLIINAEVLKAAKIYAGDVLALSAPGADHKVRNNVPVQRWKEYVTSVFFATLYL